VADELLTETSRQRGYLPYIWIFGPPSIADVATERLELFSRLESIEGATKEELAPLVRERETIVARVTTHAARRQGRAIQLSQWAALLGVILAFLLPFVFADSWGSRFLLFVLLLFGIPFALFLVVAVVFWWTTYRAKRTSMREHPQAFVGHLLLSVVYDVERYDAASGFEPLNAVEREERGVRLASATGVMTARPTRAESSELQAFQVKTLLMNELETAAQTVERELPRQLPGGDVTTKAWIRETAGEIAGGLRNEKRGLMSLDGSARTEVASRRLATALENVIRGRWAALPKVPRETLRRTRRQRAAALAIATVVALVPLAFVGLLVVFNVIEPEDARWFFVIAGAWAVVSFYVKYDPLFGTKLAALKDVATYLPSKH